MKNIGDIVTIKHDFTPVIDLEAVTTESVSELYFDNYIITPNLLNVVYLPILESLCLSGEVDRKYLPTMLQGAYGTGKTYALFMLSKLLSEKEYLIKFKKEIDKEKKNLDEILYQKIINYIDIIEKKKYIPIYIDCNMFLNNDLNDIILYHCQNYLNDKLSFGFIDSRVEKALKHLDNLVPESRAIFSDYLHNIYGINIEQLKKELIHIGNDGLSKYDKINEAAFGLLPSLLNLPITIALDEIASKLSEKDYNIVFLIDEFSPYLLKRIENKGEFIELMSNLQNFAQFCDVKNNRINLICVSHTHYNTFENIMDEDSLDNFNKVMGRFNYISIENFNFDKMVIKILNNDTEKIRTVIKEKISNVKYNELNNISNLYQVDFLESYPFNPYTIYLLPFLSNRIGQSERTSFKFILEYYNRYKDKHIVVNNNLVTIMPYDIFDYFEETIMKIDSISTLYNAFVETLDIAKDVYLGVEVVKVLFLINITSGSLYNKGEKTYIENGIPLGRLAAIFNEEPTIIKNTLERLMISNYVFYNDNNGKYSFIASMGVNPNEILKEIRKEQIKLESTPAIDQLIIKKINSIMNFYKDQSINNPIERLFKYEVCFMKECLDKVYKGNSHYVGKVIFLIPDRNDSKGYSEQFYELMKNDVVNKNINNNVFIFMNEIKFDYSSIGRIEIINKFLYDKNYSQEYAKKLLTRQKEELEQSFYTGIKETFEYPNYTCFWMKKHWNEPINNLLYKLDNEINHGFPKVNIDYFSKTNATRLLKNFISQGFYQGPSAEIRKLISRFMAPLGLAHVSIVDGSYYASLNEPNQSQEKSYYIWNYIKQTAENSNQIHSAISAIFNKLEAKPYSLSSEMIAIYISVLIKLGKISIVNRYDGMIISDFNDDIIKDLVKKKDDSYIIADFHDNDPIEYTNLANELSGQESSGETESPSKIFSAKEAKEKLIPSFEKLKKSVELAIEKFMSIQIDSFLLKQIKDKISKLLNEEKTIGIFLEEAKDAKNFIVEKTHLEIKEFSDVLTIINNNIHKLYFAQVVLDQQYKIHKSNYQISSNLESLKQSYSSYIVDYLNYNKLTKLIEQIDIFSDYFIIQFNNEHKKYNVQKANIEKQLMDKYEYKTLNHIISNEQKSELFKEFKKCNFEMTKANIGYIFLKCNNCNFDFSDLEINYLRLNNLYEEKLFLANIMIDEYIKNVQAEIDYRSINADKDIEYLKKFSGRKLTQSQKYEFIRKAKEMGKTLNYKVNNKPNVKVKVLNKFTELEETIRKSEVYSVSDLLKIIYNWLNSYI